MARTGEVSAGGRFWQFLGSFGAQNSVLWSCLEPLMFHGVSVDAFGLLL